MKSSALILGLLFFVHSFAPEQAGTVFAMAGLFWNAPKANDPDFDPFICDLLERYDPPRRSTLILTKEPIQSVMATIYWPPTTEKEIPLVGKGNYGLVIVDRTNNDWIPTRIMKYAWDALVFGGRLVVIKDGKVISAQEKE